MDAQDVNSSEQNAGVGDLAGGASDKGPTRSENQDAFWIPEADTDIELGTLYLVADGVGGQESGAAAAKLAVQTTRQSFYEFRIEGEVVRDALKEALQQANQAVYDEAQRKEVRRMGATFVAAVEDRGQLTIAHVGDARAYLVRQGEMRRLTRDDTWVQRQVEEGWITEEQAANHEYRNVVTQVLGNKPEVNVHLSQAHALQQDDVVLLCSDGLYDALPDSQMLPILTSNPSQSAANQLVEAAIKAEATDNITAVVVRPKTVMSLATAPTMALVMTDQATMPLAIADEPTIAPEKFSVPPVSSEKSKRKASNWLIILAVTAVILIIIALLVFWIRSRDLDTTVETAAGIDMTGTALDNTPSSESAGALGPAPTDTVNDAGSLTVPAIVDQPTVPPTELPSATPTLLPTPTLEATPEPRGCVNDSVRSYVWNQAQLDAGDCIITPFELEVGGEVLILDETVVTAGGTCAGVQFIKIQSIADAELEGWVAEGAIDPLAPNASCNP